MIEFIFPGEECHSRRGNDRDIVLERIETFSDSKVPIIQLGQVPKILKVLMRKRTPNPVRSSTPNQGRSSTIESEKSLKTVQGLRIRTSHSQHLYQFSDNQPW